MSTCPKCESPVYWDYACHTWPQRRDDGADVWMSCMGCNSAIRFSCSIYACDWAYKWGINSGNPNAAANEKRRPDWLPDPIDWDRYGFVKNMPEGVKSTWDDDEDDQ